MDFYSSKKTLRIFLINFDIFEIKTSIVITITPPVKPCSSDRVVLRNRSQGFGVKTEEIIDKP